MSVTAAVTETKGAPFELTELELDDLRPDEVLVKVAAVGICHTDLIIRDQWYPVPLPAVLGHEGAGVVEKVGSAVTRFAPGDRVGMTYNSCGQCKSCAKGRPVICMDFWGRNFASARPDGSTALRRNGDSIHSHFFGQSSFATHCVATERNVVKLGDSIPFEVAAPFGCGIQTGAGAVLNSLQPPPGSTIAIFGTGAVGLSAVMAARLSGCTTIVGVDLRPQRLELARELGATHVVNAGEEDTAEALQRISGGVDFAIDTTGNPQVLKTAFESTGPGGVTGIIGAPPFGTTIDLDINGVLALGRTVRGIVEGDSVPDVFLPALVSLWEQGRFPADRLMTTYDFDEIERAAHEAEEGHVIKPVLKVS